MKTSGLLLNLVILSLAILPVSAVAQFQNPYSGFDYIGSRNTLTRIGMSFPSQEGIGSSPSLDVTAVPYVVNSRERALEVRALYTSSTGKMKLNQVSYWEVDIWSSQQAFISNPWAGDIRSQYFTQPAIGSTTSSMGKTIAGAPVYLVGFAFNTGPVILNAGQTIYVAVRSADTIAVNGLGAIAESSALGIPGISSLYAFDYFSYGLGSGISPTVTLPHQFQNATPAMSFVTVVCPATGPC